MSTKKDGTRTKDVTTKHKSGSTTKKKDEEEKHADRIKKKEPIQATTQKISSRTSGTTNVVKDEKNKTASKRSTVTSSRETAKTKTSSTKSNTSVATKHSTSRTPTSKSTHPKIVKKTTSSESRSSHHTVTTPSSRITSVPFFPSKNIYSNALPEETLKKIRQTEMAKASKEDETKNKTSRPPSAKAPSVSLEQNSIREFIKEKRHEKQKKTRENSPEPTSLSERPGTATLSRGKLVNKNIVGPEVPKPTKVKRSITQSVNDKINLELQKPVKVKTSALPDNAKKKVKVHKTVEADSDLVKNLISSVKDSMVGRGEKYAEKTKEEEAPETPKSASSDENKYDDDFESYESDFEAYSSTSTPTSPKLSDISGEITTSSDDEAPKGNETSRVDSNTTQVVVATEEEKDSGHFEQPDYRQRQLLHSIKESIEKENAQMDHSRTNPASLSDEGFEESKSLQFVNFTAARKKLQFQKIQEKRKKRGEELLSMITLDLVNYTILDISPVPYDEFMRIYGSRNTVQSSSQTGEDDLDEETQTDEIIMTHTWTQYPSVLLKRAYEDTEEFWGEYKCDLLGAGGEHIKEAAKAVSEIYYEKFVTSAGGLMLEILAETTKNEISDIENNVREISFSDGYISLDIKFLPWLEGYPVRALCFCDTNPHKMLTAHGLKDGAKEREINVRSIVCVWNISNRSEPEKVLSVFGDITACCFGSDEVHMIFGGLADGTIVVWNTKESDYIHENLSEVTYSHMRLRSPTFITQIGDSHVSKVVRIQVLGDIQSGDKYFKGVSTREICSLEEDGEIIIWGIVKKQIDYNRDLPFERVDYSPWTSVVLVKNIVVPVGEIYSTLLDLQCTDFIVNNEDVNTMYVGTNYGHILQCVVNGSMKNMEKFSPGVSSEVTCLETCHFSPKYFIAGYDDGNIRLYTTKTTKPLITYKSTRENVTAAIKFLNWSHHNPLLFYVTDVMNTIHVWDLYYSDLFPLHSVKFDEEISYVVVSPSADISANGNKQTYLSIGADDGSVNVHILNENGLESSGKSSEENWKKFLNYVDRL